jgi:hypothetical protein
MDSAFPLGHANYKGFCVFGWPIAHVPFRSADVSLVNFDSYAVSAKFGFGFFPHGLPYPMADIPRGFIGHANMPL